MRMHACVRAHACAGCMRLLAPVAHVTHPATILLNSTQELKSQQPALPATVAALVQQHGWDFPASSFPTATAPTSTTLSAPDAVAGSRAAAAAGVPPPNAAVAGAGAAVAAAAGDGGGVGAGAPPPDAAAAPAGIPGSSGDPCASPAAQLAAVPGLTITSFHFEQLKRSKQVWAEGALSVGRHIA